MEGKFSYSNQVGVWLTFGVCSLASLLAKVSFYDCGWKKSINLEVCLCCHLPPPYQRVSCQDLFYAKELHKHYLRGALSAGDWEDLALTNPIWDIFLTTYRGNASDMFDALWMTYWTKTGKLRPCPVKSVPREDNCVLGKSGGILDDKPNLINWWQLEIWTLTTPASISL